MNQIVLEHAALLDGTTSELREGMHILVEGERIREVSDVPITASEAQVIDLKGKTLMPGLIDAHVHLMATTINRTQLMNEPMSLAVSRARHIAEAIARCVRSIEHGNPLNDLTQLQDQGKHLLLIMKGGKLYKNELA